MNLKARIKHFFYKSNTLNLFDKFVFLSALLKYSVRNARFKQKHKHIALPPAYFLYETYILDYEEYLNDGDLTAKEILEWTGVYLEKDSPAILEWGCGPARIIRHVHKYVNPLSVLHACDINREMIEWNIQNIMDINFRLINYQPPTGYDDHAFDLVYGLSVFTHIEDDQQIAWLKEIHRILKGRGIFLFTSHGKKFFNKLLSKEREELELRGSFTKSVSKKGHRLMTTYNEPKSFQLQIEQYFEILEYYEGETNIQKVGGQDLWIVRKR